MSIVLEMECEKSLARYKDANNYWVRNTDDDIILETRNKLMSVANYNHLCIDSIQSYKNGGKSLLKIKSEPYPQYDFYYHMWIFSMNNDIEILEKILEKLKDQIDFILNSDSGTRERYLYSYGDLIHYNFKYVALNACKANNYTKKQISKIEGDINSLLHRISLIRQS